MEIFRNLYNAPCTINKISGRMAKSNFAMVCFFVFIRNLIKKIYDFPEQKKENLILNVYDQVMDRFEDFFKYQQIKRSF